MTVYERIKERRKELHMTQDELAIAAGYSGRSSISAIEKGEFDLSIDKLNAIAEALDTTSAYLLGWEQNSKQIAYKLNVNDDLQDLMVEISNIPPKDRLKLCEIIKTFLKND